MKKYCIRCLNLRTRFVERGINAGSPSFVTRTCKKAISSKRLFVALCISCLWNSSMFSGCFASEFVCHSSMSSMMIWYRECQGLSHRPLGGKSPIAVEIANFSYHIIHHTNTDIFHTWGRSIIIFDFLQREKLRLKVSSIVHVKVSV